MLRTIGLALLVTLITLGSAQAGSTLVATDSGNIGDFSMKNMGISGGTATVVFGIPGLTSQINTVNGAFVPDEPISVNQPVTMEVTPSGAEHYDLSLVPSTYTKTIGSTPGLQAILAFDLLKGSTTTTLPNFFNASGNVVGLLANADPTYDFAQFGNGGRINLTFTATSFTGGADSFASLFATVGETAVGNGSFSQQAIPEPTSFALMGIGIAAVILCCIFKKP